MYFILFFINEMIEKIEDTKNLYSREAHIAKLNLL